MAMRADAVITGLAGVAGLPLAGWLAETSGTTTTFEYAMGAFFIAYGLVVFGLQSGWAVGSQGVSYRLEVAGWRLVKTGVDVSLRAIFLDVLEGRSDFLNALGLHEMPNASQEGV